MLTARGVAAIVALKKPGRYSDGDRLFLAISEHSKRWVFLYSFHGKRREMGLGAVSKISLAGARNKAAECRALLARGIDPLDAKKAASGTSGAHTFGQCADDFIRSKRSFWRSNIHAGQWVTTIRDYCAPIMDIPVDKIDTALVLSVLKPIWSRIPETASRLRGRIENILDAARARGLIPDDKANPARWRGHLEHLLSRRQKLTRKHFSAMPYAEIPNFIARLRSHESMPALALEFLILTAARSGEVRGARWDEIDFGSKIWTIPGERMKAGIPHRVPLCTRAVAILEHLSSARTSPFVFPGRRYRKPVSNTGLLELLAALNAGPTVHGFRSAFRDWCGDQTSFPRELAEAALAHRTSDAVELAYRRSDALERRRSLMTAWEQFCEPKSGACLNNSATRQAFR
jgi:integrase